MPTMHLPYDRVPAQLPNQKAWSPLEKRQPLRAHERMTRDRRDLTGSSTMNQRCPHRERELPVGRVRSLGRQMSKVPEVRSTCPRSAQSARSARRTTCVERSAMPGHRLRVCHLHIRRNKLRPNKRPPRPPGRGRGVGPPRQLHKCSTRSTRPRQCSTVRRWDRWHRCGMRHQLSPAEVAKCLKCEGMTGATRRCKVRISLSLNSLKRPSHPSSWRA
mmetsp:Transcript_45642/g.99422  ORF Transcript_45642/g.99422 Transcript_45642/m.99422 type:complete len:217 (-) Transcript_45642:777-1427(-)